MKTTLFLSFVFSLAVVGVLCYYEVRPKDSFDEIKHRMDRVSGWNCEIHRLEDMFLPNDTVSHLPDIKDVNINPVFPNRTALLHLHNLALSRAFFFSYISQARFIRPAINDTYDPGMMYYFLSTVADVSSNPNVNASAIYFAPNSAYTPSYRGFFNKTLPKFAPRTIRLDDYNDQIHIERISTLNTFATHDLGAFPNGTLGSDYTSDEYRINEWYTAWLPDNVVGRHDTKTTYQVEIRYSNNTNETFTFHGPPGADENPGPVKWRRPYFDCGRSNKWLFSAIVPIADIYPRHTRFRHIEYPTYTAVAVLEMDFERIDINQCPKGEGNSGPNYFADTAYCKKETTECEPLDGWGFRRGGYQCRCKPGHRLPPLVRTPYLGEIIERASPEQYYDGYDCMDIGWVQKLPIQWEKAPRHIREKYMSRYHEYMKDNVTFGPNPFHMEHRKKRLNVHDAVDFILSVKPSNCKKFKPQDLILNGDVSYGAEKYFENEAKMAVRLANFISAFLQISDPKEVFSGKRVADRPLTEDQMIGETLALVLGNSRIWAAGTYWDRNKFPNKTLFAPYAFKTQLNTRKFKLEDLARLDSKEEVYTNKEWFKFLKQRWSTNFDGLEMYHVKLQTRYNSSGEHLNKHEKYPTSYRAANLEGGYWLNPYYDCDGKLKKWIVTYAAPFFGFTSVKEELEFKGAVVVSMDLLSLDINQCPDKASTPNAFKGTHKCDKSSYCVPIMGRGFEVGGYKCECIQGYEYPFEDLITYYDGQLVEAEFLNLVVGNATRFDMFKCRLAGASSIQHNFVVILSLLLFLRFFWY